MAKRSKPESSGIVEDPLVASLVPDPSEAPPNTTRLAGYLGRGAQEGLWRLYLTPDLTEYVEGSEDDVLHSESLPDGSGTQIWVRSDLNVRHVRSQVQQVPAGQIGMADPRTLSRGRQVQPTGSPKGADAWTVAEVLPFALATGHHAPRQPFAGSPYYFPGGKAAADKKRRDDLPKTPWPDDPGDVLDPLTYQYDQLLTNYLDLAAAYEELRRSRG